VPTASKGKPAVELRRAYEEQANYARTSGDGIRLPERFEGGRGNAVLFGVPDILRRMTVKVAFLQVSTGQVFAGMRVLKVDVQALLAHSITSS